MGDMLDEGGRIHARQASYLLLYYCLVLNQGKHSILSYITRPQHPSLLSNAMDTFWILFARAGLRSMARTSLFNIWWLALIVLKGPSTVGDGIWVFYMPSTGSTCCANSLIFFLLLLWKKKGSVDFILSSFILEPYPDVLNAYSWLCSQELLLAGHRAP